MRFYAYIMSSYMRINFYVCCNIYTLSTLAIDCSISEPEKRLIKQRRLKNKRCTKLECVSTLVNWARNAVFLFDVNLTFFIKTYTWNLISVKYKLEIFVRLFRDFEIFSLVEFEKFQNLFFCKFEQAYNNFKSKNTTSIFNLCSAMNWINPKLHYWKMILKKNLRGQYQIWNWVLGVQWISKCKYSHSSWSKYFLKWIWRTAFEIEVFCYCFLTLTGAFQLNWNSYWASEQQKTPHHSFVVYASSPAS